MTLDEKIKAFLAASSGDGSGDGSGSGYGSGSGIKSFNKVQRLRNRIEHVE